MGSLRHAGLQHGQDYRTVPRTRLVPAVLLVVLACACVPAWSTRPFAESLVHDARNGEAIQGNEKVSLGTLRADLPRSCSSTGPKTFSCRRSGWPPGATVRLSNDQEVERITLWQQEGPSEFTCKLFRAVERDFRSLMGAPVETNDECDACGRWGCNEHGGAGRTWQVGKFKLVLIEGGDLEHLRAPDGTPIGGVQVSIHRD